MSLATLFQDVESVFRPTGVKIREQEDSYVLEALVAGVKAKEIEISLEKQAISINAKSDHYCYCYMIPIEGLQIDREMPIEAESEDGILKVVLPKAKISRPLKISVKGS